MPRVGSVGQRVAIGMPAPKVAIRSRLDRRWPAGEREGDEAAVQVLEPGPFDGARGAVDEVGAFAQDPHQEPEGLEVVLGPEDLDGTGVGHRQFVPRCGPRHLPVEEAQVLEARLGSGQVQTEPIPGRSPVDRRGVGYDGPSR